MAQTTMLAYVLTEEGGGDHLLVVIAKTLEEVALAVGATIQKGEDGDVLAFPKKPEHLKSIDPEDPEWKDQTPETKEKWKTFDNGVVRFDVFGGEEPKVTVDSYPCIIV